MTLFSIYSDTKQTDTIHFGNTLNLEEGKMSTTENILKKALSLNPCEKAHIIDTLISSLDNPDKELDELWAKEAENRIDAYDQGKIKAVSLENVLQKYK